MEHAGETAAEAQQRRTERTVLVVLAAVQFTTIVDFMVVMPLGPQLMRSLGIGPAKFGLIVSSYTFAAGAAGLVASSLVDRFSRRTAFLTLYSGFLLGTLWCALAPTYHMLVAARFATGACGGILGGMAMAIIGDVFPEHRRGRATGILMTGFALASIAGVPLGLYLGTEYGWHIPFIALVVLGAPVLALALAALPPLRSHMAAERVPPLRSIVEIFSHPNHLNAFALTMSLMLGGFAVIPYISPYFVANVGMTEKQLPLLYVAAGVLTLGSSPAIGKLADRYGKLLTYRVIAPMSALMFLAITHIPRAAFVPAVAVFGLLMVANSGRMIAAQAMITGSVEPRRRGGFLSANASMQHLSAGLGAYIGGLIISQSAPNAPLKNFGAVGWIAAASTLASVGLAGRVRLAELAPVAAEPLSLPAAAEATCDAGEPMIGA